MLSWGGILALGMIIINLLIHYVIPSGDVMWKNILDILGLIFALFCIYRTIYAYRALHEEESLFVALQGIKISLATLLVFAVLFFVYSLIFYNFVNKTFVEDYKQQRIEYVQQSDLPQEQKEQSIRAVESINTTSYIISDLTQHLIFPVMGMLFIVAFMQRKPKRAVENNKNQQS